MTVPPEIPQRGRRAGGIPGDFRRRIAAKGAVDTVAVEIHLETSQLFLQVNDVPEERVVEKLPTNGPDEPLHERMRERHKRDGLDLLDPQDAQVGLPSVIFEQRALAAARGPVTHRGRQPNHLPDRRAVTS